MSKYIRTKDAVYDLEDDSKHEIIEIDGKYNYVYVDEDTEDTCFIELKIIAKSDNLSELCDEFVGVDKTCENGHQLLRAMPYKCANFWNGGVYGAIWTDKGLIYVAKLNDTGELELI